MHLFYSEPEHLVTLCLPLLVTHSQPLPDGGEKSEPQA